MNRKSGKITVAATIILVLIIGAFYLGSQSSADQNGRVGYNDLKYSYLYSLSGSAPYVRFVNKNEASIWDDNASALSATTTWTDSDVVLTTKMTTMGGWLINIPAALPDGVYDMLIYDVSTAAGSRANTDAIAFGKHIFVKNARIVTISDN